MGEPGERGVAVGNSLFFCPKGAGVGRKPLGKYHWVQRAVVPPELFMYNIADKCKKVGGRRNDKYMPRSDGSLTGNGGISKYDFEF